MVFSRTSARGLPSSSEMIRQTPSGRGAANAEDPVTESMSVKIAIAASLVTNNS
jgi:hypothetical protein